MAIRCEGYCRTGGAFSLGPVMWKQCPNEAIVALTIVQDSKTYTLPSCSDCWQEAIDSDTIEIQNVSPMGRLEMINTKRKKE